MIIGTHHFDSYTSAIRYYADYGLSPSEVKYKARNGEIVIGRKPSTKAGDKLLLNRSEGRYFVEVQS